ncbi:MAG: PDZ domain-containing protein [Bacteroidetes bacterium]|nr:MAG: PDZ domain-containing protein [Bacteroidota bacterium]
MIIRGIKFGLKKNIFFKDKFEFSTSGLEITALPPTYQTFAIGSIRENSPAKKAGLERGDEFIFIENFKCIELNINQAYNLINKKSGKKVNFIIRRNGKLIAITLITNEPI